MIQATAIRGAIGSLATGQLVAVVATLGTTAVLARLMEPTDFGPFLTAWTFVTLAASIVKLGMSTSLQREIPMRQVAGDLDGATGLVRASRRLLALAFAITFPVIGVLATVVVPDLDLLSTATVLIVIATGAEASRGVGETVLRSFGRPADSQKSGNPMRSLVLLVLVGAMGLIRSDWAITDVLWALLLANLASSVTQAWQMRSLTRGRSTEDFTSLMKHLVRLAPRFVLIDASALILSQGDVLVAAQVLGTRELAIYAVTVRLSVFLLMPATVIGTAVAPQISYHAGSRDSVALMTVVRRAAALTTAVTLAGVAAFAVVGRPALGIVFGDPFRDAYLPVLILAVGATINAALQLSGWLLISVGREAVTFAVMATTAVAQLVACYLLGDAFGLFGIAWASTVGTFAQSGTLALIYARSTTRRFGAGSGR